MISRARCPNLIVLVLPILACLCAWTHAAVAQSQTVATLFAGEGTISVRRMGAQEWSSAKTGDSFQEGDTIRTGDDGKAAFQFVDGALVRLGRLSALTFENVQPSGNPSVSHTAGKAYFFSRGAKREPAIKTKTVNAAIFGTELVIDTSADSTTIDVLHGSVRAFNDKGTVSLSPGQRAVAKLGEAPTKSILVRPVDSVQWMINFPFMLVRSDLVAPGDSSCPGSCEATVSQVLTAVEGGQSLLDALERHGKQLNGTHRGALLKAIALWRVGDPSGAATVISQLPASMSPTDTALRDLISGFSSLVEGNSQGAQSSLDSAKKLRPDMINASLLQSYILQSKGDLDNALAVVEAAKDREPRIAQLYDREAELLLSFDKYDEASGVLAERRRHFGSSAMNSILSGFAALSEKEFDKAEADFLQAQAEDPSQSLAYLGQALVKVNDNHYDTAKGLLSKAVQLDPSVASYRSYLGKLYFDDEQSDQARKEYDAAIELDANDPTAFLYRSYVDVAQNDVIGGLKDVEQSIKLNNNRAVYRSTLMLDRDLAVRGAGLARVFTELGFDFVSRIESIKSISDDYGNYSAHRLLSDSYDSIQDVGARVSEERIADILSPLSFNIFNSIGESAALGDYNALFDKKENREALSAVWIDNSNQAGGSVLAAGKSDQWGYLFKYTPYYSNSSFYQDPGHYSQHSAQNRVRGALQYQATTEDRFILEGNFNTFTQNVSSDVEPTQSDDVHLGNVSLGYNHRFSTESTLLLQGGYQRASDNGSITNYDRQNTFIDPIDPSLSADAPLAVQQMPNNISNLSNLTGQFLYTSKYLDSITGATALYANAQRNEASPVYLIDLCSVLPPGECLLPAGGQLDTSASTNLTSGEVYEYLSLKIPQTANLTLGMAATSVEHSLTEVPPFESGTQRESRFNPKIGLVTTPFSWLTTRAAYFETLQKSVLEDQGSLEPSLVGGINQDYNDLSGAESQNLGFGLDAKYPNVVYAGAQFVHRNIREPLGNVLQNTSANGSDIYVTDLVDGGFENDYSTSQTLRNYLYGVVTDSTVLSADSMINWYNLDAFDAGQEGYIDTRRLRLGAKQYQGRHFSLLVQGTYRKQNTAGIEYPFSAGEYQAGGGFWLFDTALSYRFAEQHGNIFFRIDNILDREYDYLQFPGLEPYFLDGRSFTLGFNYNFFTG